MAINDPLDTASHDGVTTTISNLVVSIIRQYTGRGPTRARTYINDDLVTVVLRDILTKGEHNLVAGDRRALVLTTREAYQEVMRVALVAGVEEILARPVIAFLSSNSVDPDFSIENFVLAPKERA